MYQYLCRIRVHILFLRERRVESVSVSSFREREM